MINSAFSATKGEVLRGKVPGSERAGLLCMADETLKLETSH